MNYFFILLRKEPLKNCFFLIDNMKIALMQPYFLPYLGYFQLINAVDKFIFFDDVGFIKKGWIHRNNILLNHKKHRFTIPIQNMSSFTSIQATRISEKPLFWNQKLSSTFQHAYSKAPYFNTVFPKVDLILRGAKNRTIADVAIDSVQMVLTYLGIEKTLLRSTERYDNNFMKLSERVVDICQREGASDYINAIGGMHFFDKEYFEESHIKLQFLKPKLRQYTQNTPEFIAGLSILDVLMYNEPSTVKAMLTDYTLL
jgi:WbqC-like protein family